MRKHWRILCKKVTPSDSNVRKISDKRKKNELEKFGLKATDRWRAVVILCDN